MHTKLLSVALAATILSGCGTVTSKEEVKSTQSYVGTAAGNVLGSGGGHCLNTGIHGEDLVGACEGEEKVAEKVAEAVEDPSDFDSVLGPTEAELAQKNILERATDTGPVVLKARPVANHRVNDRRSLERSVFKASNQTDVYGLPTDRSVQFSELPPMDFGTRPRPASFQRNEAPPAAPPAKHIEALDVEDKTTQLESQDMQVVESTTKVPTDAEPMLRMTAIPYSGSSTLGAAIARIKVGKTPLIVRGEYPRDVEYERLARERNEQSTRSVIIPNDSLKTIDR